MQAYVKKTKSKTENQRIKDAESKTGIELAGVAAINPATKEKIPIWIADYVIASYGTGAIMAVPGRVDSVASRGVHQLLKSGGALLVTEPGDVLELLRRPAEHQFGGTHGAIYGEGSGDGSGERQADEGCSVHSASQPRHDHSQRGHSRGC